MQFMTITYSNGTVLEAILASHQENEIRAIVPACDDVLTLNRIHGAWISEDLEPVAIAFAWQRCGAPQVPAENECICPTALAAHLISTLLNGCEPDEAADDALFGFDPEGIGAAIRRTVVHA